MRGTIVVRTRRVPWPLPRVVGLSGSRRPCFPYPCANELVVADFACGPASGVHMYTASVIDAYAGLITGPAPGSGADGAEWIEALRSTVAAGTYSWCRPPPKADA